MRSILGFVTAAIWGCASTIGTSSREGSVADSGIQCSAFSRSTGLDNSSNVRSISIGVTVQCVVLVDGTLRCKGDNGAGQLGSGSIEDFSVEPIDVVGIGGVVEVHVSGINSVCARTQAGEVWCWGGNISGLLGNGHRGDGVCGGRGGPSFPCLRRPARVTGVPRAERLVVGDRIACLRGHDFSVWCWGTSLESGVAHERAVPYRVGTFPDMSDIALFRDQPVIVVGNRMFRLPSSGSSTQMPLGRLFSTATGTICVVMETGSVFCLGENHAGMLGVGNGLDERVDRFQNTGLQCVGDLAMGSYHVCARHVDGGVSCWGLNNLGQTAQARSSASACTSASCTSTPWRVPGLDRIIAVSAGGFTSCAIRDDQTLWCWGRVAGVATHLPQRVTW